MGLKTLLPVWSALTTSKKILTVPGSNQPSVANLNRMTLVPACAEYAFEPSGRNVTDLRS